MRFKSRLEPFSRHGEQEGSGFISNLLKKGVKQGSMWLKDKLSEYGPGAIQRLAEMATKPVISLGHNILDKVISWSGSGLRLAGRYGRGTSIAGRGRKRSSRSRSRSRSRSKSGSGTRRRRSSRSKSRSRSRSRSLSGSGRKRKTSRSRSRSKTPKKGKGTRTKKGRKGKKKSSSRSSRGGTYNALRPMLSRMNF